MTSKPIKLIRKHPFDLNGLNQNPKMFAANLTDDQIGKVLEYLSDYYYNRTALVDDQIFDQLQDILKTRNPTHLTLSSVRAPIGDVSATDFKFDTVDGPTITNPKHRIKVPLPYWMGSMDKNKPGESGLGNWLSKYPGPKCVSDKMDGMSALLFYTVDPTNPNMLIPTLMKSGSSDEAEDVSCFLSYLKIPQITVVSLTGLGISVNATSTNNTGIVLAIRAEMIISVPNFKPYDKILKNPRNMVAGVVNSKTIKTKLISLIDFVAYEVIEPPSMKASTQFQMLEKLGFQVAPYTVQTTVDEMWLSKYFPTRRKDSKYEIDGIIVCDDKVHPRNISGNPKYAFAFKMTGDKAETEVLGVTWEPQKDGYLFPVVQVTPIFLSGVTIQNCSGKNAKFIVDNCIGPGAVLMITRGGEVIPDILHIIKPAINGIPDMPDPVQMSYHWTPTNVDIILDDPNNSPEVRLKRVIAFFKTMGVANFGPGLISKCMETTVLNTVPKILNATVADFMLLPGIQSKMAQKIFDNIRNAMVAPELGTLMVASNAFGRGFGTQKIKLLLTNIPKVLDYDTSQAAIAAQLTDRICQIQGFDTKTASQFSSRLTDFKSFMKTLPTNILQKVVNPYLPLTNSSASSVSSGIASSTASSDSASSAASSGIASSAASSGIASSAGSANISGAGNSSSPTIKIIKLLQKRFQGKTVVFTGIRDKNLESLIEREGGKIGSSISSNTTILVIKDHTFTSGKVTKAKTIGVRVMSIDEFKTEFKV